MKKFFYLTLSLFAFCCAACATKGASAGADSVSALPPTQTSSSQSSSSVPDSTSEKREEATETVWSTTDIDVSHVDATRKLIAFTFDDAPDNTIRKILSTFASFNEKNADCPASATFFANGIRIDPTTFSQLKDAYAAGFELGNHTKAHKDLTLLSPENIRREITSVDEILKAIDGKEKHLVRVPYGKFNDKVRMQSDVPLIDWAIDTEDWKGIPAEKIYNTIWSEKFPGAIVLMHDGYANTVEAVRRLLPALKEEGYQVVNVSQLSKALGCPFVARKVYTRVKKS